MFTARSTTSFWITTTTSRWELLLSIKHQNGTSLKRESQLAAPSRTSFSTRHGYGGLVRGVGVLKIADKDWCEVATN